LSDAFFPSIGIHISGVIALGSLGIFLSAFGRSKVYPETEHAVDSIWFFIIFSGTIFVLPQKVAYFNFAE
jgi:hypothetical protein